MFPQYLVEVSLSRRRLSSPCVCLVLSSSEFVEVITKKGKQHIIAPTRYFPTPARKAEYHCTSIPAAVLAVDDRPAAV